ncbi:MAG TPA: hypothetical protein VHE59_16285 [Mucilaginibacter sp.]|nr:hypothetical protein [Mucilaginibacter sp.]
MAVVLAARSTAQTVKVSISRDSVLIGVPVTISLFAEKLEQGVTLADRGFSIPDTIFHFQVLKKGNIDSLTLNHQKYYSQQIELISFETGSWQIPAFEIRFFENGELRILKTTPQTVSIMPVNVSRLRDIHDIKGIVLAAVKDKQRIWLWLYVLIFAVVVLSAWILIRRSWMLQNAQSLKTDYFQRALKQLVLLESHAAAIPGKELCDQIYQVLRQYFIMRFKIRAESYTSGELLTALRQHLSEEVTTMIADLLIELDEIRFSDQGEALPADHFFSACRKVMELTEPAEIDV